MGDSSLLGFIQKKFSVVDRAIAEALQNQEVLLNLSSDEEIARQLQEMENVFISSVPDETSHFTRPIDVAPVVTEPFSSGTLNNNSFHEEHNDFHHEDVALMGNDDDVIDPDNMTYEELQELGECIGSESKGLSEETIASLRVSKYKKSGFFSKSKKPSDEALEQVHKCTIINCAICQSAVEKGELIITMPCKHDFHKDCITTWLKMNKVRPMCKYEVQENKD